MTNILPYIGGPKPSGWIAEEQERYLREKLGDELYELLEKQDVKNPSGLEARGVGG